MNCTFLVMANPGQPGLMSIERGCFVESSSNPTDSIKVTKKKKSTQERCKHCALAVKAEPKIFTPLQTPFPWDAGWPKFNQLEMVTTFTYKPSLVRIDARNFELSW